MKLTNKIAFASALSLILSFQCSSAADLTKAVDKAKAAVTPGEFVLTGTQVRNIHNGKTPSTYNICVKNEKDTATMKVTYDGQSETIAPGECKNVTGMKIEATPSEKLTGSIHIVATYHHKK
jgi:hypothetical protein